MKIVELHGRGDNCAEFMDNLGKKTRFFLHLNPSLYEYDEKSVQKQKPPMGRRLSLPPVCFYQTDP